MSQPAIDLATSLHKEPGNFSVRDHLKGSSHARETVDIFTDGEAGWQMQKLQEELLKIERKLASGGNDHGSIVDDDGWGELQEKHEALSAELETAVGLALHSRLTFHVRGVPYKQLELIFRKARKEIKPPARKNFSQDAEGEEEYELEALERNIARNDYINYLTIAASIIKVVDTEGNEDESAWDAEAVENLRTNIYDSQYLTLKNAVDTVTMAQGIFAGVAERDADFLSKR